MELLLKVLLVALACVASAVISAGLTYLVADPRQHADLTQAANISEYRAAMCRKDEWRDAQFVIGGAAAISRIGSRQD
jgi:hypothetical protein